MKKIKKTKIYTKKSKSKCQIKQLTKKNKKMKHYIISD